MPSIWAVHCPQSVYKNPQISGGDVEVHWHMSGDINRRHTSNGTVQQIAQRASLLNSVPSREHRVYNQQQEVVSRANPRNRIPWDDNKLSENGHKSSRRKIRNIRRETRKILSHPSPSARSLSQLVGKLNATTPALQMAPLFCRSLQTYLKQALEAHSQNYQSPVQLSTQAVEDLQWWEQHLSTWN